MNKNKFVEGLRDGLPIGLGYLTVSFGIGISCHNAGLNALEGFFLSLLNNASAGEYGGITVIAEDAGMITMILMTCIINARYLLIYAVWFRDANEPSRTSRCSSLNSFKINEFEREPNIIKLK